MDCNNCGSRTHDAVECTAPPLITLRVTKEEHRYIIDALEAQAYVFQAREARNQEGYDGDTAEIIRGIIARIKR